MTPEQIEQIEKIKEFYKPPFIYDWDVGHVKDWEGKTVMVVSATEVKGLVDEVGELVAELLNREVG